MAIKKSAKKASSKAAPKTMKISLVKGYTQADVIKKITPAFIKKLHDAHKVSNPVTVSVAQVIPPKGAPGEG